ncbi:MAG: hypothetical protein R3D60_06465 [Paracoccaceae bacterium]
MAKILQPVGTRFDGFLNHYSLIAVARAGLDAAIMCMYLSEGSLSETEWRLRWAVLRLHDLCNRKRFISPLQEIEEAIPNYQEAKDAICSEIMQLGRALNFEADKIHNLTKGNIVFVNGLRGVIREAGWDLSDFEFWQGYFSAFTHSHPVSFLRDDYHGISFDAPSDYQIHLASLVLGLLSDYFNKVNVRIEAFCAHDGDSVRGFLEEPTVGCAFIAHLFPPPCHPPPFCLVEPSRLGAR